MIKNTDNQTSIDKPVGSAPSGSVQQVRNGEKPFTPREAADRLGVHMISIYRWIKSGRLKAFKIGPRLVRIPASSMAEIEAAMTSNGDMH